MKKNNYNFVYTWANIVNENWVKIWEMVSDKQGNISKSLLEWNFIPSSSVMINKKCFNKVWLFDEKFKSCQDWEMWFRISKEFSVWSINEFLIKCYKHSSWSIWLSKNASKWYMQFASKFIIDYTKNWKFLSWIKLYLYWLKIIY